MNVPCDNQWLYTRSGAPPQGGDLKTYDLGQLFLSSEACADASIHGYLEVDYIVELQKKQPSTRTPLVFSPSFQIAGTNMYSGNNPFSSGIALDWGASAANAWRLNTNSAVFGDVHGRSVLTLKSGWYTISVHAVVTLSNPALAGTILEWYINGSIPPTLEGANTPIQIVGTDIEDEAISATRLVLIPSGLSGDIGLLQLVCTQTDVLDFQYPVNLQMELTRVADAPASLSTPLVDPTSLLLPKYPTRPIKDQVESEDQEEEKEDAGPSTLFVSEPVEIPRAERRRSRRGSPTPSLRSYDGELVASPAKFVSRG